MLNTSGKHNRQKRESKSSNALSFVWGTKKMKGYVKLYNSVLELKDLGLTEKVLLCYVNSFTSNNQPFTAKNKSIAEFLGVNEKTIRRAIKTLLQGGFLAKSGGISRYNVFLPKGTEETPKGTEETQPKSNKRKNQPKHEIPLPRWYDDYRKDLEPQQKPVFSEEEEKEAMEFMKGFFSDD